MKFLVLFSTLLVISLANGLELDSNSLDLSNLKFPLDKDLVDEFLEKYENAERLRDDGAITAVLNEYADKIFANIHEFSLSHNLDPIPLQNVSEKFLTASITLTEGLLHGISTLRRDGDVVISYQSANKLLDVDIPLELSNLNFTYDYHVIILLIGPKGELTGKIQDFRMDIKLTFDFNTYHAQVDDITTTNTGQVTLTFDGNGVLDVVVNVLSEFVTAILHPLIVSIIQGIVNDVASLVVDSVNDVLDNLFNPTTTIANLLF